MLAIIASIAAMTSAQAQPVAPELFGALPNVSEVEISPDGKSLAMLQNGAQGGAVLFYQIGAPAGVKPKGFGLGDAKGRDIKWADNDNILMLASRAYNLSTEAGKKKAEMWRWLAVNVTEVKSNMLFGNEPGYYNSDPGDLLAIVSTDETRAIFSRWTGNRQVMAGGGGPSRLSGGSAFTYSLHSVNARTGKENVLESGSELTTEWVVDRTGGAVARVDYDSANKKRVIFVRDSAGAPMRKSQALDEPREDDAAVTFYGMTDKADVAYAIIRGADGDSYFGEFNLKTGAASPLPQGGVGGRPIVDFHKGAAIGLTYTDDLPTSVFLDPERQKAQGIVAKALPGAAANIISQSGDGTRFVVKATYADHPDQFFLYDRPAKKLDLIARSYEKLDGRVFARKEKFDYVAPDGLSIPGYLTVPKGASKKNMPLIVLPHGGPAARDDMSFDWWPFFYAARGYLVYQPNFRGSEGYGEAFERAGDGEWGRKMQDDITNGVKKLIADGVADPKRVCIVGASYGGYAALVGGTLTPELYACVISVSGIANLPGFLGEVARDGGSEDYLSARIGNRFRDQKALEAVSPMHNAGRAVAPFLLIHGRDDTVVPPGQSRQMRDALLAAKKSVEHVELKGEDHWLSLGATRTEMLARSIAFLDKHIGR
jgi:dipeptidyl aminopeptidase/acylaminoacyl peptidase